MWRSLCYVATVACLLTACAINDVPGASSADLATTVTPALILNPPGELKLSGDCNDASQLEAWLQVMLPAREDYETKLAAAVPKSPSEMVDDVLSLVALRNIVYSTATPDCALESQILMSSAFNQGIDALQAIINGTFTGDLATTVIEVNIQLTQVAQLQDELIKRMESEYEAQNAAPAGG